MAPCCICPTSRKYSTLGQIHHTWANIALLGKYNTLGKSKCSVTIQHFLQLNSVQVYIVRGRQTAFELSAAANVRLCTFCVNCCSMAPRSTFAIFLNKSTSTKNQLKHCHECNIKKNSTQAWSLA